MNLLEKSRNELVAKSKRDAKGLQRYKRRVKSRIAPSVKEYNRIDMNALFKNNILNIAIKVTGETDNYIVKISFGGLLDTMQQLLKNNVKLDLSLIIKAIVKTFNNDDVYVRCSCPDYYYRFGYQATRNKYQEGEPQLIPANVTNPNDSLGSTCKHVLLVLANTSWIIKVASVIFNYINWMQKNKEKQYADIIYPKLYGKKYEEPVQLAIDDTDELASGEQDIDASNIYARTKTQFKPGNPYRYEKPELKNDLSLFDKIDDEDGIDDDE